MSNTLILNADIEQGTINRHIYGHFADHLGRCHPEWKLIEAKPPQSAAPSKRYIFRRL
jgi:alpha-L-arabinofuranosidase